MRHDLGMSRVIDTPARKVVQNLHHKYEEPSVIMGQSR